MRQLKYIGVVFAALMLFTACEKEFDAIPEDFATVPEGSDEAWPQTVTIKDLNLNLLPKWIGQKLKLLPRLWKLQMAKLLRLKDMLWVVLKMDLQRLLINRSMKLNKPEI